MISVDDLLLRIQKGGAETEEAALILGLLIEREIKNLTNQNPDKEINTILGAVHLPERLTPSDQAKAIDGLSALVSNPYSFPQPIVVWALSKSYQLSIVPTVISLFYRICGDPNREEIAYQCIIALINSGTETRFHEEVIDLLQEAAENGLGKVKETANQYLSLQTTN